MNFSLLLSVLFFVISTFAVLSVSAAEKFNGINLPNWQFMGPGGALNVQSETMEVSSAANDVVKIGGAFLLATVNGGVWRTTDPINTTRPHWVNVFDNQPVTCQSMTRLYVSPNAPTTRVYALCGASTSSQMGYRWNVRNTGVFAGFMVSNDAGITWKMANFIPNYSLEGIVELPNSDVVVAVRGHFYAQDSSTSHSGGIWVSSNIFDQSSWTQTSSWSAFALHYDNVLKTIFASTAASPSTRAVLASTDSGRTWSPKVDGIVFGDNFVPFYSMLAGIDGKALFLGVMLTLSSDFNGQDWVKYGLGAGWGRVFYLNLSNPSAVWRTVGAQPAALNPGNLDNNCYYDCIVNTTAQPGGKSLCCWSFDYDWAAKDRGALFVIPGDERFLYVSGNSGSLIYRVNYTASLDLEVCAVNTTTGKCNNANIDINIWAAMWNQGGPFKPDVLSNSSTPHVDTRNINYDPDTKTLLLVSDGGIFVRYAPSEAGVGWWKGFAGDIGTFEYLHASYDIKADVVVAAAQDNNVHIFVQGCSKNPTAVANSWTGGDGTWTAVDNTRTPARLFGSNQFAYGLSYVFGNNTGTAPPKVGASILFLNRGFPDRASSDARVTVIPMPFFETVYRVNPFNTDYLYFWANTSVSGDPNPNNRGIFKMDISDPSVMTLAQFVMGTEGQNIQDFVTGGFYNGNYTENVIVAASGKYVFTKYGNEATKKITLPVQFAEPVSDIPVELYCTSPLSQMIVPCTPASKGSSMSWPNHGKSVSVAVAAWDARIIAVTGWDYLQYNKEGNAEAILVSTDAGATWTNVFGDLATQTTTIAKVRPFALAFVKPGYLVAGSVNGNYALDYRSSSFEWTRLGTATQFPQVVVGNNDYYADIDALLTATMGRGVYKLNNASSAIASALATHAFQKMMDDSKKALAIALGICIPIVFLIIVAFLWKKIKVDKSGGKETNYRQVEEQGSHLEQA